LLAQMRTTTGNTAPEVEVALARISPKSYLRDADVYRRSPADPPVTARAWAATMQGLRELAAIKLAHPEEAETIRQQALRKIANLLCVDQKACESPSRAVPDALRAYAAFKAPDLEEVLRVQLALTTNTRLNKKTAGTYFRNDSGHYGKPPDVIVRATAADLMADLPPSNENRQTLIAALPVAFEDELNDAAMSILDALGKQKNDEANNAIKTALDSKDLQVRRKAVEILKTNGVGDFSSRIGSVQTRNTNADYQRALSRIGKDVRATVNTSKGSFVIKFLPEEAPLTVDNFVMLARKGYFNGQIVPRVVPNFVIQTGDPRGDQNGGPGYSIRCEINQAPYDRGAVGMALSGKDTGGSQWFVTHSPQPHLDGGYTVFGKVVSGMDVVDSIVRDDTVRSITISENAAQTPTRTRNSNRKSL
jgi:cyclophilin family peptidyl-prolyl cis-trans isomerase